MTYLQNLSIARKLALSFGALIAVIAIVSAVIFLQTERYNSATATRNDVGTLADTLQRLGTAINGQKQAVLRFMATGDLRHVEAYETFGSRYAEVLEEARGGIGILPDGVRHLDELNALMASWQTEIGARQLELMRNPMTINEARMIEFTGVSAANSEQIDTVLHTVKTSADTVLGDVSAQQQAASTMTKLALMIGGPFSLLFAVLCAIVLSRGISRPIQGMTGVMEHLSSGNTDVEIPGVGRRDEIGAMADSVTFFKDSLIKNREMAEEQRREQESKAARAKLIEDITQTFEARAQELVSIVSAGSDEMRASAETMSSVADNTRGKSLAVASASEQASANVQTVASASEEIATSLREVSAQVARAMENTRETVSEAERTNGVITGLSQASAKIGDVVELIEQIAAQTNLLALNATIEAARAGDAGKGFAVVASEVKTLADQTAKATGDISAQIEGIQSVAEGAVGAISSICTRIGELSGTVSAIAAAVEEQAAATQEIARNVNEAARGTDDVNKNIVEVQFGATETGSAAEQVLSAARELAEQSNAMRSEVDRFLTQVRAA